MTTMQNNARFAAVSEGLQGAQCGMAYIGERTAIAPGALGRLSAACDMVNRLQETVCKTADALEKKVHMLHGPRPEPGAVLPSGKDEVAGGGGFDHLHMKLQNLEGFLARLERLANQI